MLKKNALLLSLLLAMATAEAGGVVVIGHPGTPKLDSATLEKIFTGKLIEVAGVTVTPINFNSGNPVRARFLQTVLKQDEEKYLAYWTVRRYIGKGAPPREVSSSTEVINLIQATPGAIGYIDDTEVRPGMNVLFAK